MRAAARESGLNAEEIARRLGVRPQTVYRWWTDQRVPEGDWLRRYAAIVHRPVSFFYAADQLAELVGFLKEFMDLVMRGEDPAGAWDQLTGSPDALPPMERADLGVRAPEMRDYLESIRGNWELLTDDERQEVAEIVARKVRRRTRER
jgi:transcriptional regulator with XRE-family HTH domain